MPSTLRRRIVARPTRTAAAAVAVLSALSAAGLLVACGGGGSGAPRVDAVGAPSELDGAAVPPDGGTEGGAPPPLGALVAFAPDPTRAEVGLVDPGAEVLGDGWTLGAGCDVAVDGPDDTAALANVTAPGNGRAHFRLGDGCELVQVTGHELVAGQALSLAFDASLAAGDGATLVAALDAVTPDGARRPLAERAVALEPAAGGWRGEQLLTGFGELDAAAGARVAVRLRATGPGTVGLDALRLGAHAPGADGVRFADAWAGRCDEPWAGERWWANRLHDWEVEGGRLRTRNAVSRRPMRTVHRVRTAVSEAPADFGFALETGIDAQAGGGAWSGILLGAGHGLDHRGAALVHNRPGRNGGLVVGIDAAGRAFVADNGLDARRLAEGATSGAASAAGATLQLDARHRDDGTYLLDVFVRDASGAVLSSTSAAVDAVRTLGNVALASNAGGRGTSHWFASFTGHGAKLLEVPARDFGPVLFATHTVSRGALTLNAQLPPTCPGHFETPELQALTSGEWRTVATASIDPDAHTARFVVPDWDASIDVPYRVRTIRSDAGAADDAPDAASRTADFEGVVRADPIDADEYVLGLFNCRPGVVLSGVEGWIQQNNRMPFTWTRERIVVPHEELLGHAARHEPDMVAFVGDQIYEFDPNGLIDRESEEATRLDYLWKWFQFGWAVRELTRSTPAFVIPDDHDVYQGNVWGQGGRIAVNAAGEPSESAGGYVFPARFVRMVQRTQAGSLPDPYDPTPVDQGIETYYTDIVHGRVGIAVLEDRKFKTGPDDDTAPKVLLGERQLGFLDAWARDWAGQDMKMVVSQSPFAQSTTHSGAAFGVNGFDQDANGWPKPGRDRAVAALRRAYAPHVSGDQHLGMTLRHGIAAHGDAVYGFAGPSMLNIFPRVFDPNNVAAVDGTVSLVPGPGDRSRPYTGPWIDPHGNPIDVVAAANPDTYYAPPPPGTSAKMDALGIGYGLVRVERDARAYAFEAWPARADPLDPLAAPYPDWPVRIEQTDNDGRVPAGFLADRTADVESPVVEVVNETTGELVWARRMPGAALTLPVHDAAASYRVTVSDPDVGYERVYAGERVVR